MLKQLKAAKEKAIEWYRNNMSQYDTEFYDEAHNSVKEFHKIFGTKERRNAWLDFTVGHIDDNILNLKGLRLRKYIWNNFKNYLYKGKYYSTSGKYDENGKYTYKKRYSRIILESECVLTGRCYDNCILQPIYDFLNWSRPDYDSYQDIENLFNDCFSNIRKCLEDEEQSRYGDDYIIETITANEYEFTADGNRFL